MGYEELKGKFIRETEAEIDRKRKRVEELMSEAEVLDAEVQETRRLLHLLKTGEELTSDEVVAKRNGKPKRKPKAKKRAYVRVDTDEVFDVMNRLITFSNRQLADAMGRTPSVVLNHIHKMEQAGKIERINTEPTTWRISP